VTASTVYKGLVDCLGEQLERYQDLLNLTQVEARLIEGGRPLPELEGVLARKAEVVGALESVRQRAGEAASEWRSLGDARDPACRVYLRTLVEALTNCLRELLDAEEENAASLARLIAARVPSGGRPRFMDGRR